MKCIASFLILFVLLLSSCCTEDDPEPVNGTYSGYFSRSSPNADFMSSNVILEFKDNTFTGSSDVATYPAICNGTYTIKGSEIEFENLCPWTANFDWTFILDGKFQIAVEGNDLTLTRTYSENVFDQYVLTRQ